MENKLNELRKRMIEAELHKVIFSDESKQRVMDKVRKPRLGFFLFRKQFYVGLSMALCIGILALLVTSGIIKGHLGSNEQAIDPTPPSSIKNSMAESKRNLTIQEAVDEGDIVKVQVSNDVNEYYNNDPNAIKVYNLEKIFAFEDNVDAKGKNEEIKITFFQKGYPPTTDTLSFDGQWIHYKTSGHEYQCQEISTFGTWGAELYQCTNEDGRKVGMQVPITDSRKHFEKVKEEYKEKLFKKR